ncbi:MAG TPA: glycerophosphodiester phosphodiesterase family protein [Rhizobiaceae bacterium]|nr:glycerophosphodiester phosphodiesterase family protein [Rhizobiaceae bacterium]
MRRRLRLLLIVMFSLAACIFLANSNLFVPREREASPTLLAHRGIAQRFEIAGVERDDCSATAIAQPSHDYLENTIRSMSAAFEAGADVVEFDVHPTTDGQFAVIHDWTLDCRTDGHGVTREHSMAELKTLDIGYGYTADGGKTFPFRGKGRGLMPTMDEVLATFPDRRFLINVKSNDPNEGTKLAAAVGRLPPERRALLVPYGGDRPIEEIRRLLPDMKIVSRGSLKACLLRYAGYGWTGLVPNACRNLVLLVPTNVAPWLWGWPDRFLARMRSVGTEVFVVAPWSGGATAGIDTPEELKTLPKGYSGGIWTNAIEVIGPIIKRESGA